MEIFNSFESLQLSLFSTNGRHSIIALSGPSSAVAPKENLAGRRSTELSLGQSYTWGKAITNSACHPGVPHTLHTHTDKHTHPLCSDLEAQPSGLQPPCTFSLYFIPPLPAPPCLHVILCHSPQCNFAQRRAATVLRNSVIYWQFPP